MANILGGGGREGMRGRNNLKDDQKNYLTTNNLKKKIWTEKNWSIRALGKKTASEKGGRNGNRKNQAPISISNLFMCSFKFQFSVTFEIFDPNSVPRSSPGIPIPPLVALRRKKIRNIAIRRVVYSGHISFSNKPLHFGSLSQTIPNDISSPTVRFLLFIDSRKPYRKSLLCLS